MSRGIIEGQFRRCPAAAPVAAALILALAIGEPATGLGQTEREGGSPPTTAREDLAPAAGPEAAVQAKEVFRAIAAAWSAEDHDALAALVAQDGVEIALSPAQGRDSHYSPDQAFYFFKTLFQSAGTDSLRFRRLQEETEGGTVHVLADWELLPTSVDAPTLERLVFTIAHDSTGWGLTEIRAIR